MASRFPVVSSSDIDELIASSSNKNTQKVTNWSFGIFEAWRKERMDGGDRIPELLSMTDNDLNCFLARFVVECRRLDKKEFPPNTLYQICCGLQRYLRENNLEKCLLDTKNSAYSYFRNALDAKMKQLTNKGIGIDTKQADALSIEDEMKIWQKGIFGNDSADHLLLTVYFYNCKLFGLRGRDEHRSLDCSQIKYIPRNENNNGAIQFQGRTNKTYKGGLSDRNIAPKVIRHEDSDDFRISEYYQEYLELIGDGPFYRKPLPNQENLLRFSKQVIGVNTLSKMISRICGLAGLEGNYTGHSGKASTATQLYEAGVPENLIQGRTGHRSLHTLRMYNRPSEGQKRKVSQRLNPPVTIGAGTPVAEGTVSRVSLSFDSLTEFYKDTKDDAELGNIASEYDTTNIFEGAVLNNCVINVYSRKD